MVKHNYLEIILEQTAKFNASIFCMQECKNQQTKDDFSSLKAYYCHVEEHKICTNFNY